MSTSELLAISDTRPRWQREQQQVVLALVIPFLMIVHLVVVQCSLQRMLTTVHEYLERPEAAGIGWPMPEGLSDEELEAKLFGAQAVQTRGVRQRPQPD